MLNLLSIKNRLIVVIVTPLAAMLCLSLYGLLVFKNINAGVTGIYSDRVVPLQDLKDISDNYAVLVIDAVNKANAGMVSGREAAEQITQARQLIDSRWQEYLATELTATERTLVDQTQALFRPANREIETALSQLSRYPGSAEQELHSSIEPLYLAIDPVTDKISELVALQIDEAGVARDQVARLYAQSNRIYIGTTALMLLLLVGYGLLMYRSIKTPLEALRKSMDELAHHSDLSVRVPVIGKDEIADVALSVNDVVARIDKVFSRLTAASQETASAAEEMSSVSVQTKRNIEAQTEQTNQVAVAMNEMAAAAADVSRSATETQSAVTNAQTLSHTGRKFGEDGSRGLAELSEEIGRIADSIANLAQRSSDIRQVVEVITSIADQTNLLALNAAIEAARAGEQGRGFAVVADEVRSLAKRTQDSTEEITTVISALQRESQEATAAMQSGREKVEDTRALGEKVAEQLRDISAALDQVTEMGTQIASAAEQQSVVADQVSGNVSSIMGIAQENHAGSQHVAEGSAELARLAAQLQDMAAEFRSS
ncbi:methyl-accepting chemotaxis protein [Halopseudomonas salegens]|uniref:Methyl-accepting chemotaxis sensory transducer n=1 Tax=Halopseudomonas salegens TaxID=1434072 RepID=A0A1H2E179_9GAMM|nr:methyl-accepting chemotaxis protein [Halopseudomonas salegens]SDT88805.1 methyl-accepting chemotaxis sensory transducer [Halopseudomonas salegens]